MPTHWVRLAGTATATLTRTLVTNVSVYQNSRGVAGNITLVQEATVVAGYLFGVSTTADTWSMTLCVVDEARTPTYSDPEINAAGGSDPEVKGQYIFALGPLLYQPKRLIDIKVESEFIVRINKEEGGNASTFNFHFGFLLNTRL